MQMPKLKTVGAKKRFQLTASGLIKAGVVQAALADEP